MTDILTGKLFLQMLRQGADKLETNKQAINDLNVFPIPDGDTGDNMFMTIDAGCSESSEGSLSDIAKAVSKGALLGARGNSGVILSRFLKGLSDVFNGHDQADIPLVLEALNTGVSEAYGAVSEPVEGTMLTVLRESVSKASGKTLVDLFTSLVEEMKASLNNTPELLPVLKEAGVVDSGGAGILSIAQGMLDVLNGVSKTKSSSGTVKKATVNLDNFGPDSELTYGYCTEFLLRLQNAKVGDPDSFDEKIIRSFLNEKGDSVVCFKDGSIVKVHVHTKNPGEILSHAQIWGEFLSVKIENMTLQHSGTEIKNGFSTGQEDDFLQKKKVFGCVAVAFGEGLIEAFRNAGVDEIIEGGQTMNPSTSDFIEAFDKIKARHIIVFPNNSNVILTANQAAELYKKAEVIVIPCKSIGAGYVAAASIDYGSHNVDEVVQSANAIVSSVITGSVTKATRNAELDGISVTEGYYFGISGGHIMNCFSDREQCLMNLAEKMGIDKSDVAILFPGSEVTSTEGLTDMFARSFPRTELMLTDGGQPVYDYILVLC